MSTPKESTLEIKDFRGISRYLASPNEPPNKLKTIQNLYSPNRGELAYVNGVVTSSPAANGFTNLIGDYNFKGQRLITHSGLDTDLGSVDNSKFTFTGAGGGSTTAYIRITYCGMGYETDLSLSTSIPIASLPSTGVGVKLSAINSAGISQKVCSINFYISNADTLFKFVLGGCLWRADNGTFTAPISFPGFPVYDSNAIPLTPQNPNPYDKVSAVTLTPAVTTGGILVPGQTYYLAFCPFVVGTHGSADARSIPQASTMIDISSSAAPTLLMSFTLPEGYNSVLVQPSMSGTYNLVTSYVYSYVFIGTTPEDLVMAENLTSINSGTQSGPTPIAVSTLTGVGITIGRVPKATNLGLCTLPYAQSYPGTQSVPQYIRGCYFWPGRTFAVGTGLETVAFLLFPEGILKYSTDPGPPNFYQILPVRGAGFVTAAGTGQQLINGAVTYNSLAAGNTLTGTITSGSPTVTAITSTTGIQVNMSVSGTGIPAGTFVTAIPGGTSVTLSANATSTNTGVPLTFGPYAVPSIAFTLQFGQSSVAAFKIVHGFSDSDKIQGAVYQDRIFFVNNFQQPFYTNGDIIKPLMVDAYTSYAPIASAIQVFQGQLIMGGGITNNFNTKGNYYWSNSGNPFSFSQTPSPAPDINSDDLVGNGPGNILGFGVFSYNQAVNSITTQLVIGLDTSVWMTPSTSEAAQQTSKNIGFASPNCMVNTNIGAIYLGRDNLYQFNTYGLPVPKGNDVLQLLSSINKSNTTAPPLVLYTQNQVKIMYHVSGTDPVTGADLYDTELWCDVQLEHVEGQGDTPRFVWTGPHTINRVLAATVFPTGVYELDTTYEGYRTGVQSQAVFILDAPGFTANQGANAQRVITFNDLYLNADDFIKLFTRVYIGGKCTRVTPITITFSMTDQDGAGEGVVGPVTNYTETMTLNPNSLNVYQLFQKMFATRYRGRIVSNLSFTWNAGAANETINFYELGLLFSPTKRRLL